MAKKRMDTIHGYLWDLGRCVMLIIDFIAVCVIVWGFTKTLWMYFRVESRLLRERKSFNDFHSVRQELASYLLLSLEFVIAGDIIHTISSPTVHNILLLGLIVAIRTSISFILERELRSKISKKKKTSK